MQTVTKRHNILNLDEFDLNTQTGEMVESYDHPCSERIWHIENEG